MDKFVARENIRHFWERLETETNPTTRSLLHELLVQEEDKLGHNSEALQQIDNHIATAKGHVARQQACLASTEAWNPFTPCLATRASTCLRSGYNTATRSP